MRDFKSRLCEFAGRLILMGGTGIAQGHAEEVCQQADVRPARRVEEEIFLARFPADKMLSKFINQSAVLKIG